MRLKDKLGSGYWTLNNGTAMKSSSIGDEWNDRSTSPERLAELAKICRLKNEVWALWNEWQCVGRRIQCVKAEIIPLGIVLPDSQIHSADAEVV